MPDGDQRQVLASQHRQERGVPPDVYVCDATQIAGHGHHGTGDVLLPTAEILGVVVEADGNRGVGICFDRVLRGRRDRPVGRSEHGSRTLAVQVGDPRPDGPIEFALHPGGVGNELACLRRSAGRNQPANGFGRQDGRLAFANPIDPGQQLVVVAKRHTAGILIGRSDIGKAVLATERGAGIVAQVLKEDSFLLGPGIVKRGLEGRPRRSAGKAPGGVGEGGFHHVGVAAAMRRPAGVRLAGLSSQIHASSSPAL